MRIPRVFHQIWLGGKPFPDEYRRFQRTWTERHPGWRLRVWTEENLPPLVNEWAYANSVSLAAKANVARYEILLREGGIYLDVDFECRKNIEPLVADVDCFVARQRDEKVNNAIIGVIPRHPFVRDLVESLDHHARVTPDEVPSVTQSGPYYLSRVIERHPEVTVFGPDLFYPYEWHERWRRDEEFPEAYAVHHWTLSARETEWPTPYRLGDHDACLSVVVSACEIEGPLRLEWVLEGLCVQAVSNFEVLLVDGRRSSALRELARRYRRRLEISYLSVRGTNGAGGNGSARARNVGLARASAARVLFLDGDCLPDPDVVEAHAGFGGNGFVPFGFRRIYPQRKLYRFVRPVDYPGLTKHSLVDPRRAYPFQPFYGDWRDLEGFCFSVSADAARDVGGFDERLASTAAAPDLARKLAELKHRLVPLWDEAQVTHLGPPDFDAAAEAQALAAEAAVAAAGAQAAGGRYSYPHLPPISIEVVRDDAGRHQVDENSPIAPFVRVGLWDHAYNAAGDIVNDAAEASNFVGSDTHRFYFRVRDANVRADHITIDWRTLNPDGTDDDRPASQALTLTPTGAGSGVFVSRAVMLVTDDTDRNFATDSGLSAPLPDVGKRAYGQSNHRTRRAKMTGSVRAEYRPASSGPTVSVTAPVFRRVPEERLRLPVRVINYGSHATAAYIQAQFANANRRWNQIGLQIDPGAVVDRAIPAGVLDGTGKYPGGADSANEQAALNDLIPVTADNTFTAVFVPLSGSNAYTTVAQRTKVALGDRYFIFIDTTLNLENQTLAHELAHALFNRFDDASALRRHFTLNTLPPTSFGIALPDVRIYRRIQNLNSPDPDNDPNSDNILNWARRQRTARFPIGSPGMAAATATTGNTTITGF